MAVETVTVRLSRSDRSTTWGFRLQGGKEFGQLLAISKIIEGSLADRAGLKEGDKLAEICGKNVLNFSHAEAQQNIISCGNNLDLVVSRNVSTIWSPKFPANVESAAIPSSGRSGDFSTTSLNRDYSKKTSSYSSTANRATTPVQPGAMAAPTGYSPAPLSATSPGGSQFNYSKKTTFYESSKSGQPSPGPQQQPQTRVFSPAAHGAQPRSPATAYLETTGGLFGTDPKAVPHEEPTYLRSETLKLIQEEQKGQPSPVMHSPVPRIFAEPPGAPQEGSGGLPICENCGQRIIGVFCKAGGKSLHAECFKCATCGASLKNIGYFLLNEKLYCELHAKQQKGNQFQGKSSMDPNIFATFGAPSQRSPRSQEPPKASYQPDILKPGGEMKPFGPGLKDQRDFQSSKVTFIGSQAGRPLSNAPPLAPRAFSPAPFSQQNGTQKEVHMSSAAGDGIQMFGPKTPNRGRGILKQLQEGPRIPVCESCRREIRGPFVLALGKSWCPDHFLCSTPSCHRQLIDVGFIEQNGAIHCEYCFEKFYAPKCSKCHTPIVGDCLTAIQKQWHPECFTCAQCHKPFGNASFFLENGQPYCERDWNSMFTTKCSSCQFPIEAGDRWVEALGNSFHSDCFCCTVCQKTLEGQSFYAKGGRPFCKAHA